MEGRVFGQFVCFNVEILQLWQYFWQGSQIAHYKYLDKSYISRIQNLKIDMLNIWSVLIFLSCFYYKKM